MARKGPLRKVIGRVPESLGRDKDGLEYFIMREQLECGHIQPVVEDMYGPTNAFRRRCRQCKELEVKMKG